MTSSDAPVAVETEIPITSPVRSLVWSGDTLVDWSYGRSYSPNGETISFGYFFGRQFDAATTSQDKQYTVIFAKTGTKGLVLDTGKVIREINRSYYQSDVYEYPVAIIQPGGGRKILAHCPTSYNRLEFEDLQTGEPLGIEQPRNPDDFFHSRLSASPNGEYLVSAGWAWHPIDVIRTFHVPTALNDPSHLDGDGLFPLEWADESSAAFMGNRRLVVALAGGPEFGDKSQLRMRELGGAGQPTIVETDAKIGTMMPVGDDHVLGLHENPKLISLHTGQVLKTWPHISSGSQTSAINPESLPIAFDPAGRRCAIASERKITILSFS